MPAAPNPDCVELLYRALAHPIGIAVRVSEMTRARAELYRARTLLGDVALATLSLRVNPLLPESELWLMHASSVPREASGAKAMGKASPQPTLDDL